MKLAERMSKIESRMRGRERDGLAMLTMEQLEARIAKLKQKLAETPEGRDWLATMPADDCVIRELDRWLKDELPKIEREARAG